MSSKIGEIISLISARGKWGRGKTNLQSPKSTMIGKTPDFSVGNRETRSWTRGGGGKGERECVGETARDACETSRDVPRNCVAEFCFPEKMPRLVKLRAWIEVVEERQQRNEISFRLD